MSRQVVPTLFAALLIIQSGCMSNPTRPNTVIGGLLGGATGGVVGAAIGAHEGKAEEGALIGAVAGGITGSAIGNQQDRIQLEHQRVANEQAAIAFQSAVTMDQVVQMTQSGLNEELIINQIQSNGITSSPTTNDLIQLKNSGVSDRVIQAMQSLGGAGYAPQPTFVNPRPVVYQQPVPFVRGPVVRPGVKYFPPRAPVIVPKRRVPNYRRSPRRGITIGF